MSYQAKNPQTTFYDEHYEIERPWIGTVAVASLSIFIVTGIIIGIVTLGDMTIQTGMFVVAALCAGAFLSGFTAYRTWTNSRSIAINMEGFHYRFRRGSWAHIPLSNIRGWQVSRRSVFWLKLIDGDVETLVVHLNQPDDDIHVGSIGCNISIRTRQAFNVGQAIDWAKIHTHAIHAPAPHHTGTIVMDRDSAMAWLATSSGVGEFPGRSAAA